MRHLLLVLLFLSFTPPLFAAVEIALRDKAPLLLEDVYQQQGVPYLAIEDVIGAVGLRGHWDSVKHIFRIRTKRGWAEISPASSYLKFNGEYYPLKDQPRFIDGRLRVTDSFVLNKLSLLVDRSIYFRNLDPPTDIAVAQEASSIDRLFSFLLKKKAPITGPLIRAVAIDAGHGGLDTGVIAVDGFKEKKVSLAVAEKLKKQLKMKLGIPIYLSRDGDYELTLEQRLAAASKEDVDLWLLLHAQATFNTAVQGVTLFIRQDEVVATENAGIDTTVNVSLRLAEQLALALREAGILVNGIYSSPVLSLGRGNLPTVQVELGYLSYPEELANLQTSNYQEHLAAAIYQGIRYYAELEKEINNGIN